MSSESIIKLEHEQDPAYHAVLDDFKKHCQDTILHYDEDEVKSSNESVYNTLGHKYDLNSNCPKTVALANEIILLCAELAFWIYTPKDLPIPKPAEFQQDDFSHWHYKKVVESHKTQISQWAFLQFSGQPKDAFLVFKGTNPEKVFDILADTAVIPMPIWCRDPDANNISNEWQFCGHSGMYATLMRDFHRIWKIINDRMTMFDHLYVIGHSLGGGLAVLFGLESIINKYLPSNKTMKIVTFGTPAVISYENGFESLSRSAKRILFELHNICHCFVNRFDPIPRVPTRIEWMMTVIPYALKKIIADQVKSKMNLPGFMVPLVKSGVKSGVSKFVEYVEKYLDLLCSYHPFGTYYFFAGKDCDEPFIIRNQTVIQELLGFIPPHKIVTSDGQELRVSHFSTKSQGIKHVSRFSLENVTELILNKDKILLDDNDKNVEEKKMDIGNLLRQKTKINDNADDEGVLYDNSALYVIVESVESDEYKSKKLSEKGWIMLVSNHLMEQYIDIFKAKVQCNKSKYPMLPPNKVMENTHFGIKEKEKQRVRSDTTEELKATVYATANLLKSTGTNLWNQAKDTYKKEKKEYMKKKEEQRGYPGLNRAQTMPAQQQQYYYAVPPQQYSQQSPQYVVQGQPAQTVYVQQPINIASGQQIGNTQYRIANQSTHYVVYQQPQQPQPNNNMYPSLAKK